MNACVCVSLETPKKVDKHTELYQTSKSVIEVSKKRSIELGIEPSDEEIA